MRTKTLLLTAALGVAGIATSMAQVYSVNAVGYVNVAVPTGFSLIANPLDAGAGNNTIVKLFANVADGTTIYKFNNATGQYSVNVNDGGEWGNPSDTLEPGDGAFIKNPGAATTVTFVGEVKQGHLTTAIPAGFSIKSSQVPQSGQLDTALGFPAADGDVVYRFNNASSQYIVSVNDGGEWSNIPTPNVGEAFFVKKVAATSWVRDFSVNQ